MSTISGTLTSGVTLGAGYTSPLTIAATGRVSDSAGAAVYAGSTYANAALINLGTVSAAAGSNGVEFRNGGSADNNGLIQGDYGIFIDAAAGTVTNTATIIATGTSLSAAGVHLGAGGYIANASGSIEGRNGIDIRGLSGTVINVFGTVTGTGVDSGAGVLMRAGGTIVNTGGLITGDFIGIEILSVTATVINSGTIATTGTSSFATGIYLGISGYIGNGTGLILGAADGVYGSGTLNNNGTIAGAESGVHFRGGSIYNTGLIQGADGIYIVAPGPGTVTNADTIAGTAGDGIAMAADGSVGNNGTIQGTAAGVDLKNGGRVINAGFIEGDRGVFVYGSAGTVSNSGTITGTLGTYGVGVRLRAGGSVVNNAGSISGTVDGIYISNAPGTVTNFAGIGGNEAGVVFGGRGYIANLGGRITGGFGVYIFGAGTIIDSGTIVGTGGTAIRFGGTTSNRLELRNGYKLVGGVAGAAGANDALVLGGTLGAPLTVDYNGLGLTSFEGVLFGTGDRSRLKLANNSGTFGLTISGFDSQSEYIDLTAIGSNGTITSFDTTTDQVTVTGSLGSLTFQFDSIDGMNFNTAPDASGGTDLIACFLHGTLIRTEAGEVPVEQLAIGDRVVTLSGETKPIKWIGQRAYDLRFVAGNRRVLPVRVAAGALADGMPARDLWVSPEHSLFIDGVLVQAVHLVNGTTITQPATADRIGYFHIELEAHDVIFAEGAAAETFVDCDNRYMFQNAANYARLYPEDARPSWQFCAPRPDRDTPEVTAIRAALLARAESLGRASRDPNLHLLIDGRVVRPLSFPGGVHRFVASAGARSVTIASRRAVPAETEPNAIDLRGLGVPLERLVLCGRGMRLEIAPDCPALAGGFHPDEGSHRWTDGCGALPPELLACFAGGDIAIEVQTGPTTLHYPVDAAAVDCCAPARPNILPYSAAALSGAVSGSMPRARL